jgi:hypothetical protein
MNLELNQQGKKHARVGMGHGNMQMPGIPEFVQGGGSGTVQFDVAPHAMQFMRDANQNSPLHQGARSEPTSSDMIPTVKGLSNLQVSFGSGSDVSMTPADSVLGKRMAEGNDEPVQKLELSLRLGLDGHVGGKPKRGKKGMPANEVDKKDDAADSVAARTRRKSSTGPAGPGNLTGPHGGARQAQ